MFPRCRHQGSGALKSPSASPRVRFRRRRCRHQRRLPRGASLPLRLSARCCVSDCPVGVANASLRRSSSARCAVVALLRIAVRAFGVRLRRVSYPLCVATGQETVRFPRPLPVRGCGPFGVNFGAVPVRLVLPRSSQAVRLNRPRPVRGASLRRSASTRCSSVSCCHGAVGRSASFDLFQSASASRRSSASARVPSVSPRKRRCASLDLVRSTLRCRCRHRRRRCVPSSAAFDTAKP